MKKFPFTLTALIDLVLVSIPAFFLLFIGKIPRLAGTDVTPEPAPYDAGFFYVLGIYCLLTLPRAIFALRASCFYDKVCDGVATSDYGRGRFYTLKVFTLIFAILSIPFAILVPCLIIFIFPIGILLCLLFVPACLNCVLLFITFSRAGRYVKPKPSTF